MQQTKQKIFKMIQSKYKYGKNYKTHNNNLPFVPPKRDITITGKRGETNKHREREKKVRKRGGCEHAKNT